MSEHMYFVVHRRSMKPGTHSNARNLFSGAVIISKNRLKRSEVDTTSPSPSLYTLLGTENITVKTAAEREGFKKLITLAKADPSIKAVVARLLIVGFEFSESCQEFGSMIKTRIFDDTKPKIKLGKNPGKDGVERLFYAITGELPGRRNNSGSSLSDVLTGMLKTLTFREREILKTAFNFLFSDTSLRPGFLVEDILLKLFKIDRKRMLQIRDKALKKLRHHRCSDKLKPFFKK
jgi:hypothetical protein